MLWLCSEHQDSNARAVMPEETLDTDEVNIEMLAEPMLPTNECKHE